MDTIEVLLKQGATWGFLVGMVIAFFVWKAGFTASRVAKRELKRLEQENKELQGHLSVQLKINASGNEALQKELEALKQQNENLRVNYGVLQQKGGRLEVRQLQVYERAISAMRVKAPGFAGAWEDALKQAEGEVVNAENGLSKLLRKVIPGIGLGGGSGAEAEGRSGNFLNDSEDPPKG